MRVLLRFCLIFCQYKPGVAYKSAAYKKACNSKRKLTYILKKIKISQNGIVKVNMNQLFSSFLC